MSKTEVKLPTSRNKKDADMLILPLLLGGGLLVYWMTKKEGPPPEPLPGLEANYFATLICSADTYADAHNGYGSLNFKKVFELSYVAVGQSREDYINQSAVLRGLVAINTASLAQFSIRSAALGGTCMYNGDDIGPFDLVIVSGVGTHVPAIPDDFDVLRLATTSWGKINTSQLFDGQEFLVPLNSVGLSHISRTGNTLLGLRHEDDINGIAPPNGTIRNDVMLSNLFLAVTVGA